jgi:hypothetical protein
LKKNEKKKKKKKKKRKKEKRIFLALSHFDHFRTSQFTSRLERILVKGLGRIAHIVVSLSVRASAVDARRGLGRIATKKRRLVKQKHTSASLKHRMCARQSTQSTSHHDHLFLLLRRHSFLSLFADEIISTSII